MINRIAEYRRLLDDGGKRHTPKADDVARLTRFVCTPSKRDTVLPLGTQALLAH